MSTCPSTCGQLQRTHLVASVSLVYHVPMAEGTLSQTRGWITETSMWRRYRRRYRPERHWPGHYKPERLVAIWPVAGILPKHISSHLHILTSSNVHTLTSSHHTLASSHLHMFTSSHPHIFTSSPHIFTSSHPHIFTSSHSLSLSLSLLFLARLSACAQIDAIPHMHT